MNKILQHLPGVVCHVDDILMSGNDQEEHNSHLLKNLEAEGVTLNKEKCQFACTRIIFLIHMIRPKPSMPA